MKRLSFILIFLSLTLSGIGQQLFTSLSSQKTNIHFKNNINESTSRNVLTYEYFYNGGGVAVGDLNNDGLPDIVFTANIDQPKVYFNKGNLVFEDVTRKSGIRADGWKTGVTMVDINNDGWLDVYVCRSGQGSENSRRNLLFINQKNNSFKESAAKYGLDDYGQSTQASFFDYDKDGDLDLFLLNHSIKRFKSFDVAFMKSSRDSLAGDKLFRNDNSHFTDVSSQAGIIGNPIGFGLGVAIADFNVDGWPDIYVSNDFDEDDYLYLNQKNGKYKESLREYMGHTSKFSMGCDVADINNDALLDLITLDMLPQDNKRQKLLQGPDSYDYFQMLLKNGYYHQYMRNMLHIATKSDNGIAFQEIGQMAGISNTDWSWSALFGDFDLNGWQDLFVTNGFMRDFTNMDFLKYIAPEKIKKARALGQEPDLYEIVKEMPVSDVKNYLFKNTGKLKFENANQQWGMDIPSLSNGASYVDLDNDGDLDLVVNNINQEAFIWQNHAETLHNNYLKLRFEGSEKNPFGIGAKVIISSDDGFVQIQELQLTHGFQSSVEPCLLFGLGKRNNVSIKIIWPDGKIQNIINSAVNKTIVIKQEQAEENIEIPKITAKLFKEIKVEELGFTHIEDIYNDFKKEPLLPHQFSKYGPALASGDVNADGKEDLFIGGAKGQAAALFINYGDGKFTRKIMPVFNEHSDFEDVGALFFDIDRDGDLDLYVMSGGNEANFQDRIYLNDSKGNFSYKSETLPQTISSGGAIVEFDFDHDGDLDIFRGGHVRTGLYPLAPTSYLFENDNGVFRDVTPGFLKSIGMISTARSADINKDGLNDLILAGEFMPIIIFYGQKDAPFFSNDKQVKIPHSSGWWNCIAIDDIDNDGDMDIVGGNIGLNSQMQPTINQPVTIDAADIDKNGTIDAIISYYIQGKSYPLASRDEILDQVASLKTKFPSYKSYSDATIDDIFNKEQLGKAIRLSAEEFRSGVFINNNGSFHFNAFENEIQIFPVRDLLIDDFTKDNLKDILAVGNNYAVRAQSGRFDSGKGVLLSQNQDLTFSSIKDIGLLADKDARRIIKIDNFLIIANNNDKVQIFRIN